MTDAELRAMLVDWAEEMGASHEARKKWRQRRVPAEWKLRLMERAEIMGLRLRSQDLDRLLQ